MPKHATGTLNVSVGLNSLGLPRHCIFALVRKAISRVLRLTMSMNLCCTERKASETGAVRHSSLSPTCHYAPCTHSRTRPPKRAVGITFAITVPLPSRFGPEYDPRNRPASTPILLKPGDRKKLSKPRKVNPSPTPKKKPSTKTTQAKKAADPKAKKTPEEQKEYDRTRTQTPERQEYQRRLRRKRSQTAKESGQCVNCTKPAITDQTRCETCSENHRQSRRSSEEKTKAANPAT